MGDQHQRPARHVEYAQSQNVGAAELVDNLDVEGARFVRGLRVEVKLLARRAGRGEVVVADLDRGDPVGEYFWPMLDVTQLLPGIVGAKRNESRRDVICRRKLAQAQNGFADIRNAMMIIDTPMNGPIMPSFATWR